jgi:hypothetical protein
MGMLFVFGVLGVVSFTIIAITIITSRPGRNITMSIKNLAYLILRFSNDINAVQRGKIRQRIGRRLAGRYTGKLFGKIFG